MKMIHILFGLAAGACFSVQGQEARKPTPVWLDALQMHTDYTRRVIDSPGFGASRMPAVFQSITELRIEEKSFRVERVGLIGIAEHPQPVAFVSPRAIPRLGDLTNAMFRAQIKKRELTKYEKEALPQLREGKEVVADLKAGVVVGAMRARQDCLKCHDGKVGILLGAISYVMTPVAAPEGQKLEVTQLVRSSR